MSRGFKLARVFGIEINIDWSWLFIFALVLWNLSAVFGNQHPDWSTSLVWGTALVAATLFFGSVLAHELAHSLMAKRRGMEVRSITLFLFGGVSNIEREPSSPRDEFLIAAVGPLTSLVLGAAFTLLAWSGADLDTVSSAAELEAVLSDASPLTSLLLWLGPINIVLAAFNMLPGFPLDGGRILRSVIWSVTGSLRRATRMAAQVGQGIAWLMILGGIGAVLGFNVPVIGANAAGGLWFAFIGWFLNQAAQSSYQQLLIRDVLGDVRVARLMQREPPTVEPDITVQTLVDDYLMSTDGRAFPVVQGDALVGLVTLEDVRAVKRGQWSDLKVADIVTRVDELVVVDENAEAAEATGLLARHNVGQLPVVRDGKLVGLLRQRDIVRWLELQDEKDLLGD